ncbi:snapalysin family zinc-dependent metalloprotease [Streptomyces sp. NBC_00878]|uniref:snapalysin family zinc-dependent metalloprotease n=1 Tax=Streptomyces sp. NBC_00878 TaxID=2975854 RepID=UPI002254DC52|nr:snapalysin family zinc-dependent metalloprotease [Streptomyces sp. NBC_00878]MCX4902902.1 snapalysin family zinc-dependent metalloprotease [Streptomyces sp. NBC_00878]
MHVRKPTIGVAAVLAVTLSLMGGQAVAAPSATASSTVAPSAVADRAVAARVVTYDASASAEFKAAVDRGAAVWNESVDAVELRPVAAGQRANIRILADNGWPRALPTTLGNGTVYIGRQAVVEGHDTIRISAHELGHILGLPDIKPGPCTSLMSGSTAGTSCKNPYPDAVEKAEVEDNFGAELSRTDEAARSEVARSNVVIVD